MPQPQLIVITPVRNEAWVLEAFLTHCSSWADRIIIADQHSTDGSRGIARKYPKVTLIDNSDTRMDMSNARRLLFEEVDKIHGDKILFAMDADEFLSDGFMSTAGWKKIITSTSNTIFCFKWLNLVGDYTHAEVTNMHPYEWACHFSESASLKALYAEHVISKVHEARVPCTSDAQYVDIDDIQFVHLGRLNNDRTLNKTTLYQIISLKDNSNAISIYRFYHHKNPVYNLPAEPKISTCDGIELRHMVQEADYGKHYVDEIVDIINRNGIRQYLPLHIWENKYMKAEGINPNLPFNVKLLHFYLRLTQQWHKGVAIRSIDKILKILYSLKTEVHPKTH